MDRVAVRKLSIAAAFAMASLLLAGCAAQTGEWYTAKIDSLEEHAPDRALVLFDVDITSPDEDARDETHPAPKWRNISIDEEVDDETSFWGKGLRGEVLAYSVKPGLHRLFVSSYKRIYFWFDDPSRHIAFFAQPGEVVYIGKLAYTWDIPPGKFSIKIENDAEEARAFLRRNYPALADDLEVRLARYVRIAGLEQPFGGRTRQDEIQLEQQLLGLQNYWLLNQ